VWLMAAVAATILASTVTARNGNSTFLPRLGGTLATIAAALIILAGFRVLKVNNTVLNEQVANNLPVHAVEAIQAHGYAGPLYNDFNWGGFLSWYLAEYPVAIDGRNDLYGDKFVADYLHFNGGDRTDGDPQLDESGIVLLSKDASLAKLLKFDSRFKLVYEDQLSDVFLRN